MCTLLFQAKLPSTYWAEALHAAIYLLNCLPAKTLNFSTPYFCLYQKPPSYDHLRVFGCLCYPSTATSMPHKLSPRSTPCIFLGYPSNHKGYRCIGLTSRRVIISRHVIFDESAFPFSTHSHPTPSLHTYDFLASADPNPIPQLYLPTLSTGYYRIRGKIRTHQQLMLSRLLCIQESMEHFHSFTTLH